MKLQERNCRLRFESLSALNVRRFFKLLSEPGASMTKVAEENRVRKQVSKRECEEKWQGMVYKVLKPGK